MKTCLYKPIFINPLAYYVFPQLYNIEPKNTDLIEYALYSGQLIVTDITNDNTYSIYNRSNSIDLSKYNKKCIRISLYTDTGAVVLGEWNLDIGNESGDTDVKPIASYRCYDKTNDDADRDVLQDLTGNGHDIQLYNFAFAESSGYGKYVTDFTRWYKRETSNLNLSKDKIEVTGSLYDEWIIFNLAFGVNEYTINVKGLKEGLGIYYTYVIDGSYKSLRINSDGLYTIPQSEANSNGIGFKVSNRREDYTGLIIEQIPNYQGALVSDGVDDYGLCENFPILTKEKGYTICAIRENFYNESGYALLSNGNNLSSLEASFIFEGYVQINNLQIYASFGRANTIVHSKNMFSYGTSTKYNGTTVAKGELNQSIDNVFSIFSYSKNTYTNLYKGALYALEIYDRDLTDEEIAKVKERMIAEYEEKTGEKYPIEYPGLIAAWSAEGKTNSDPDRNILKDLTGNGHDITLHNFAFNSEGSGYEHPDYPNALVFDGVDDYGINENMPILTDYTVIIKRTFISKRTTYTISKARGNFGAFGLESPEPLTRSFGGWSRNIKINFDGISWQTKNSYNQQPINSGNNVDSNFICLGSVRSGFGTYFCGAIYSAYLFDRSLDEQEIKSFIRKYIDPDYVLPSEQTT